MFRFTIRELVLLTLVVAMGVGWWVDRERLRLWARKRWDKTLDATLAAATMWADERQGEVVIEVDDYFSFYVCPSHVPYDASEKPRVTVRR